MSQPVRVAVAVESKCTELREFEWPSIPADGGLLRIEATGICRSDWHNWRNSPKTKGRLILGHSYESVEMAMRISASGCYRLKEMCPHQFALADVDTALLTLEGEGDAIHCSVNRWQ